MADRRKNEPAEERGLPTNVDAERFVLGSILLDDGLYPQVAGTLEPDDFSLRKHQLIFRRMGELGARGERIDRVTVANELMKFKELEECDGLAYLVSLDEGLPRIPNIDSYVRIVKEKARQRTLVFLGQNLMNRALLGEEDSSAVITSVREKLLSVEAGADVDGLKTPGQIIQDMGGLNVFLGPRKPGLPTGFVRFDDMTGGLYPGDLFILAARPSMGKTSMALNIATHVAVQQRKKVAIFSLEMSKEQLMHRMVCAMARVDSQRAKLNYLTREERTRLALATAKLVEAPLYLDDHSAATAMNMHARLRRCAADGPVALTIVDYLQLMSAGRTYENKNQEVTAMSRGLKLLGTELQTSMLVLSQLTRDPEKRKGNARPILSDLRESGAIEQDADVVGFIFRPEVYSKDREDLRGLAELIVAKQRNGPVGTVNLVYLHNLTKFESRAEDLGEQGPPPLLEHEYTHGPA